MSEKPYRDAQEQKDKHKRDMRHRNDDGNRNGYQSIRPGHQPDVRHEKTGLEAPNAENVARMTQKNCEPRRSSGGSRDEKIKLTTEPQYTASKNISNCSVIGNGWEGRKRQGRNLSVTLPKLRRFSSGIESSSISPRPHFVSVHVPRISSLSVSK